MDREKQLIPDGIYKIENAEVSTPLINNSKTLKKIPDNLQYKIIQKIEFRGETLSKTRENNTNVSKLPINQHLDYSKRIRELKKIIKLDHIENKVHKVLRPHKLPEKH